MKREKSKFRIIRVIGRRVGSILGANNFVHSVGLVQQTLSNSVPRTRALWNKLIDKQEKLTEFNEIRSDSDRFWASMEASSN